MRALEVDRQAPRLVRELDRARAGLDVDAVRVEGRTVSSF